VLGEIAIIVVVPGVVTVGVLEESEELYIAWILIFT
jgi:hypothetical protein